MRNKNNQIKSNAKSETLFIWLFAIIWNAISFPVALTLLSSVDKLSDEPALAFVFIFPLIGLGVILVAINAFNNWRKFGATPLTMDPYPGSISGHVGGTIDTSVNYDKSHKYLATVSCIYSYISGTGKNRRSRKKEILWQTEGVCFSEASERGTKIGFRFDIPPDLPASDEHKSFHYHFWRVSITCELPETDLKRNFDIPVKTGQRYSEHIHQSTETFHRTVDKAHENIYEIAQIRTTPGGLDFYYPAFKKPAGGIFASVFGIVFAATGIGTSGAGDVPVIFSHVFTLIGIVVLFSGIWDLAKSLHVKVNKSRIKARRFFLGYPITTKETCCDHIRSIEIKQGATISSGSQTVIYYSLLVHTNDGEKIIVAERLTSKPEVELIKENLEQYVSQSKMN